MHVDVFSRCHLISNIGVALFASQELQFGRNGRLLQRLAALLKRR